MIVISLLMSMQLNEFMYDKSLIDSLTTADLQLSIYLCTAHYELSFTQPILGSDIM